MPHLLPLGPCVSEHPSGSQMCPISGLVPIKRPRLVGACLRSHFPELNKGLLEKMGPSQALWTLLR